MAARLRISKNARVRENGENGRYGNVTKSLRLGIYEVLFDGSVTAEEVSARAMKAVDPLLGLSPASKSAVSRTGTRNEVGDSDASSSDSEDEEEDQGETEQDEDSTTPDSSTCPHVKKRKDWVSYHASLVGQTITVSSFFFFFFSLTFFSRLYSQVKDSKKNTLEWTIIDDSDTILKSDCFQAVPGPVGTKPLDSKHRQGKVLKDFVFTGDSLFDLFMHLYPGNFQEDFEKVNRKYLEANRRRGDFSLSHWVTFFGLLLASTPERGRDLWRTKVGRGFRSPPNFGQYMPERLFENIKAVASYAFSEPSLHVSDPWWRMRSAVRGFNANRRDKVVFATVYVGDESMSAFKPRKSKLGGLPNISFIKRKPKPLGTEFKSVAEGRFGIMVYLEIQEGMLRMRQKAFCKELGANGACAMRMALGTLFGGV